MAGAGAVGRRGPRSLVAAAAAAMLLVACVGGGRGDSGPPAGSRAVHFRAADGLRLDGRLFGEGSVGVVLSHMLPADQRSWYDFAGALADEGYLALTYDFRGYCPGGDDGCSEGDRDIGAIWQDVAGAAAFLESRGASRIVLVGASMGGTASLVAASRPGTEPVAIVTLSAPVSIEDLVADTTVLQQLPSSTAKLFVAGEFDTVAAQSAEQLYDQSAPPKRVEIFPTDDHGTDLLTGSQGPNVANLVVTYLAQFTKP